MKTARLLLVRDEFTTAYTTGKLYLNGKFFCHVVEDMVRTGDITVSKIRGVTAIPKGSYRVELTYSPKFGEIMPLVVGVRNFSGIRMHSGVSAQSSEGCMILSYRKIAAGKLVRDNAWRDLREKLKGYSVTELQIKEGAVIRLTLVSLLLIGGAAYYLYKTGKLKRLSRFLMQ